MSENRLLTKHKLFSIVNKVLKTVPGQAEQKINKECKQNLLVLVCNFPVNLRPKGVSCNGTLVEASMFQVVGANISLVLLLVFHVPFPYCAQVGRVLISHSHGPALN